MKLGLVSSIFVSLLLLAFDILASEPESPGEVLAQRGKGVLTQTVFTARANKIPADIRQETLRNGNRLRDLINMLLLRSQLAAEAREAGFDKDQVVIDRMRLAAETELAEAWMEHYVDIQPEGNYEQLAHEYYLLHQDSMLSSPTIDVSHILVSTEERTDSEARELADEIGRQLARDPAIFEQLVAEYSEDPSAGSNKGKFRGVKKGDMVKPFEEAAFALQEGEISAGVKTEYGYHIIRLDAHNAAIKVSFDDVKQQFMENERKQHRDRIKRNYLNSLTSIDVEMSEEALQEMIRRQFGENYTEFPEGEAESE